MAWWTGQQAERVKAGALYSHFTLVSDFPNGLEDAIYLFYAQVIV